jgi:S1-C subfamily serine protease
MWRFLAALSCTAMAFHGIQKKSNFASLRMSSRDGELINVFEETRKSVAFISRLESVYNPLMMNVIEVSSESGSGFVWDEETVITNYHVTGNNEEVQVAVIDADENRISLRAKVYLKPKKQMQPIFLYFDYSHHFFLLNPCWLKGFRLRL